MLREGRLPETIAQALGVTAEALRKRFFRALQQAAEELGLRGVLLAFPIPFGDRCCRNEGGLPLTRRGGEKDWAFSPSWKSPKPVLTLLPKIVTYPLPTVATRACPFCSRSGKLWPGEEDSMGP